MSHEDSLDDETKRLLAEVDSDDSTESSNFKNDEKKQLEKKFNKGKEFDDYYVAPDVEDSERSDDMFW